MFKLKLLGFAVAIAMILFAASATIPTKGTNSAEAAGPRIQYSWVCTSYGNTVVWNGYAYQYNTTCVQGYWWASYIFDADPCWSLSNGNPFNACANAYFPWNFGANCWMYNGGCYGNNSSLLPVFYGYSPNYNCSYNLGACQTYWNQYYQQHPGAFNQAGFNPSYSCYYPSVLPCYYFHN